MSETRICPVCENEIPEDARYSCRYCGFDLKMLNDEEGIERAKQTNTEYHDGFRKYLVKQKPNPAVGCVVVMLVSLCLFLFFYIGDLMLSNLVGVSVEITEIEEVSDE